MKSFKLFILVLTQVFVLVEINAQEYKTSVEVISSGGGESIGGNYSHFGVLGETFVDYSVRGGDYNTSIGFINSFQEGPYTSLTKIVNSKIIIYPNPVKDYLAVKWDGIGFNSVEIFIYDFLGEIVKQRKILPDFVELNLSDLEPGMYFVKISFEDKLIIEKLIKE